MSGGDTPTVVVQAPVRAGDRLHLWMRPRADDAVARLTIHCAGVAHPVTVAGPARLPLFALWEAPAAGDARLEWSSDTAEVSVVYAFTPGVARSSIRVLWTGTPGTIDPARHRLHFRPPFGWMNDPNGLCEVDGVTHLFYQHNPHARRWNTMHWGHAISRDGIAWLHLPIALLPPENLLRGRHEQGGVYSGAALPRPDGTMRLFYTDRQDSRVPAREWQMTAVMAEGRSAEPATLMLDSHPPIPGYRNDWRDPFVFEGPDGRLKMLLGGADDKGSLVLIYDTDDPEGREGWRFLDVLFREASPRNIPAECPCMIALGGGDMWVLIFGLIGSRDGATRRRNLTRTFIGRFDGRCFEPLQEHELDFGTDCYATQVWRGADGPRCIAWAANWTDVHADRDFDGAMTLPRRLLWHDGHLFTPPIDAAETLRIGSPVPLEPGGRVELVDGLAELVVALEPGTPFRLTFDHPTHDLAVSYDGQALELEYEPPGHRTVPRYRADHPGLERLRLIIDVGLIEIYADGGRTCCTKRIDSSQAVGAIRLAPSCTVRSADVWALRAAEMTGPSGELDTGPECGLR